MKRTNKNVKETAKPAQQSAFKTPAQELEEFKAKVLAMKHGGSIWLALNGRLRMSPLEREVSSRLDELWPKYRHLLNLNPDQLKAYRERYDPDCPPDDIFPKALRRARGRPRNQELAERDALIYSLYKQETEKTDQQVANMLEHKHGIKMSRQAVRRAYDREEERRRRQETKLNSR